MKTIEKRGAIAQLESLRTRCELLCVKVDAGYDSQYSLSYFVVSVREDVANPNQEIAARRIQEEIACIARQYPDVVCYRFDSFSTLLYII